MPDQEDTSAESTETTDAAESTSGQAPAFDPSTLSPEARAYLKSQTEAAKFKAREGARTAAAEEAAAAERLKMAKHLGLIDADEAASPQQVAEVLEAAEAAAFQSGLEAHLYRIGPKVGVDIEAALDSRQFGDDLMEALEDMDGVAEMSPRSKEFKAAVADAFQTALDKNPRFKPADSAARTGPRPDLSQGARGAGPDVDSRIAEARSKGDWKTVIHLENQKLNKIRN
jgi:hypothetical protein